MEWEMPTGEALQQKIARIREEFMGHLYLTADLEGRGKADDAPPKGRLSLSAILTSIEKASGVTGVDLPWLAFVMANTGHREVLWRAGWREVYCGICRVPLFASDERIYRCASCRTTFDPADPHARHSAMVILLPKDIGLRGELGEVDL